MQYFPHVTISKVGEGWISAGFTPLSSSGHTWKESSSESKQERLDLRYEMWRRLILHETGFPSVKFFTFSFIDGRIFFRIFAFYIVFDDLYACINTRKSIREKLHHCQRAKAWWTWRVISIIPQNKPHAHHKTHLHTTSTFVIVDVYMFITFLLFGNDVISLESRPLIFVYLHTINRPFHCIFSTFYIDQSGKVRWYHRKERLKGAV